MSSKQNLLFRCFYFAFLVIFLSACGQESNLSPEAALGERAFNDPILSASGKLSCATCHAANAGHNAPNDLAVQLGGTTGLTEGLRASQTLRYLAQNTAFSIDADGVPSGGFFWDGRANDLLEQAAGPLLGAREMANADKASVVQKIAQSSWASTFKSLYGASILNDPDLAFQKLTQALAKYQQEDSELNAFTSKFDQSLRGKATLTAQEADGLRLFNDASKGNCAACHTSEKFANGNHPLFTDFSYDNLGIPRNPQIAENNNPSYFDLGLCGRPDLSADTGLCGGFKVPTLRNVALKKVFFHNGRFKSLTDSVTFYAQRDTHPEKWYPLKPDGSVNKFNDLPVAYHANVNTTEAPYNRTVGDAPALNASEIEAVVAFLNTLTDGWKAP